ncbi:MAG: DUF4336 domain-containing protein [bacterium]|nr:DUF4336 domain-containing protein [bacterium]
MLEALGEGIWTADAPLSLAGARFGTRMTVVQLGDGGVVLISPIPIDDAAAAEIEAIGPVRAIVAPNAFHHFYFVAAAKRFPEAACFVAPGTEPKLKGDVPPLTVLGGETESLWTDALRQVALEGTPATNEIVFFHAASRTLIVTDLCFHFEPAPGGWTGIFLWLAGARGGLKVSRLMRSMMKDRVAVRASIGKMLEYDFDDLVVAHGSVVRGAAKEKFRVATGDL